MPLYRFLLLLLVVPALTQAETIDMLQGKWQHERDPRSAFEIRGLKMIFSEWGEPGSFDTVDLQLLKGEIDGVFTRGEAGVAEAETLMLISDSDTSFWPILAAGMRTFSILDQHARTAVFERVHEGMLISPYHFVYNDGTDTLDFYSVLHSSGKEFAVPASTQIIRRLQLDGTGPDEIIFKLHRNFWESRHGGTFDITENGTIETYMIWNRATGKCLWWCNSKYFFMCNNFQAYSTPQRENGYCSYSYNIQFGPTGDIMITDLIQENEIVNSQTEVPVSRSDCMPDKEPGIYRFINGRYKLEE